MNSLRNKRKVDGRVGWVIVLASIIIIVNLFGSLFSKETESSSSNIKHLGVDSTSTLYSYSPAGEFENTIDCEKIPNKLRPIFSCQFQVNSVEKELLMTIKGIGPGLAGKIIEYRATNGPFKSAKDLLRVSGIGARRAKYLETVLTFDETPWNTKQ